MTDKRLQVFCTLAECLSFSQTAKLTGISQPAVTKHIAALEAEFGCALFVRFGRNVMLTEKGVEEQGSHRELMEKGGIYASLYSLYTQHA